jgi:peptidoglycan/xylan/chitin deacetylase (PgdA/CDA1 family)
MLLTRRAAIISALALTACGNRTPAAPTKQIAITMDDFGMSTKGGMDALTRDARIRAALAKHDVKALGYITSSFVDNSEGRQVLADWAAEGHALGNHTHTHPWSNKVDTDTFWADVMEADARLRDLPGFEPHFRFPFLRDGGDRAEQLDLYARLSAAGYYYGPIGLESFDWYVTERLDARIAEGGDPAPFGDYWIKSVTDLAEHYHRVATQLGYPDLPLVMLTHHVTLDGMFLEDLMDALAENGWGFVDATDALAHPVYQQVPPEIGNSRNLLDIIASARDADVDPYPKAYYQYGSKTMDALGL